MSELTIRANKVTVKVNETGKYVAEFYRTHKKILTVTDTETGWEKPTDSTKTGERESFRAYVINNAEIFGILWKPEDMRNASNIRVPRYETDDQLIADAITMVTPDIDEMVDKCKYGIVLKSIEADRIEPKTQTSKGIQLSGLGINGGKYEKSGNWAWADVAIAVVMEYRNEEIYYTTKVELVSGQLKKPKLTITAFNEYIKGEIVGAGLATEEELDPPKEPMKVDKDNIETPSKEASDMVREDPKETSKEAKVAPKNVAEEPPVEDPKVEDNTENKVENKSGRKRTLGRK